MSSTPRGIRESTWQFIYRLRRGGIKSESTDSSTILKWLILYGRMPLSYLSGGHALMNAEAEDDSKDIVLKLRLRKGFEAKGVTGCGIKRVMEILGDRLDAYVRSKDGDLEYFIYDARSRMNAESHNPGKKSASDMQRAIGLWLYDRKQADQSTTLEKMLGDLQDFVAKVKKDFEIKKDDRSLERYLRRTQKCIEAGKALPMADPERKNKTKPKAKP
jgi:hypothetical protein